MTILCRIGALMLALLCGALPCRAENLSTLRTGMLPSIPGSAKVQTLAVVDGRPVAIAATSAWVLAEDEKSWAESTWRPAAPVHGAIGNGQRAYLLLGTGALTERVERLTLRHGEPATEPLPALPAPLANAQGTLLGDAVVVVGTALDGKLSLWRLDPSAKTTGWQAITDGPTAGRVSAIAGQTRALFVSLGGAPDQQDRLWRWSADAGWAEKPTVPGQVLPGSARATGQAHVLYLVYTEGQAVTPKLMMMHTITGSWATLGDPLVDLQALDAHTPVAWRNGLVWRRASSDGTRSEFPFAEIESGKLLLKWPDWVVIAVYLGSVLGIGLYFYLREKRNSTSDFFVGGRTIPFWAAGVSLYAANTSSISYIAIPAKAFETNWQYLTNNLIAVLGLMFVAVWIVPLLRRLDLMSVFSYLETRFHPAIRMLASGLFIITQLGSRMSVILFLPSLAIATITGINVVWSILLMGGFTIVYTALGGMKAVVWTDIVQLVVKMGGALFAIGFIIYSLRGGVSELVTTALAENKTKLFDFSFDLTKATVWGFIFLVLFDVVLTFPKDQVLMQRTLSTRSAKDAGRSVWALAAIMIPGGFIFYSIGTALFVFYKAHPERMNPLLPIDATFPLFIAAELPMGVTGLIIAGIFAAAMATLSSIMNSVSTLASVDFYERLVKHPDPAKSVRFAEWMTVVAGLVGIGCALLLSRFDVHSLFDVSIELFGVLGGGFAGAYTLGMFTRRANSGGVAIGVGSSIVLTTIAWTMNLVHPYFYLAISIMQCIVIGYVASFLFPQTTRSLKGLTIYTDAPDVDPSGVTRSPVR